MTDEDVTQAISIELNEILKTGWSQTDELGIIVVSGPDTSDFISEVWRIARFVAYDKYVSIERQGEEPMEYVVSSRSKAGMAFEIRIRAK